ncbi:MAG: amidohydrolase, partial [Gammaproteobacteria bacterium]
MHDLTVSLIQAATHWHDPKANMAMYGERIEALGEASPDLIVLPETLLSGFTREAQAQAETMDGPGVAWMREMAQRADAVVTGSLVIADHDAIYNRLIWATPEGGLEWYDKRHLFRMAGEHKRYAGGRDRLIVEWRGWRICPLVCYDLRFPVFCRNRWDATRGADYDLLLFVANWPQARRHAWRSLLVARAIENLSWVVGVNRVGRDGNDVPYAGDSLVVDPLGELLADLGEREESATLTLSAARLLEHRER